MKTRSTDIKRDLVKDITGPARGAIAEEIETVTKLSSVASRYPYYKSDVPRRPCELQLCANTVDEAIDITDCGLEISRTQ